MPLDVGRLPMPLDVGHLPLYPRILFFGNGHFSKLRPPGSGRCPWVSEQSVHLCVRGVYTQLSPMGVPRVIKRQGATLDFVITASNHGKTTVATVPTLIC